MEIIGISGFAQAGKTILAKEMARIAYERGMTPMTMSFAGALKKAAIEVGADKEKNPELYRKFCQEVGFNMRNPDYLPGVTGNDYWVNLVQKRLSQLMEADTKRINDPTYREIVVIFDDVRYQNEVDVIKSLGGKLVFVDRGADLPDPHAAFRNHESEDFARMVLSNDQYRRDTFMYTIHSGGPMEDYLIAVRPYIPVLLGLEVPDIGSQQ